MAKCGCGTELPKYQGRGRPPSLCEKCKKLHRGGYERRNRSLREVTLMRATVRAFCDRCNFNSQCHKRVINNLWVICEKPDDQDKRLLEAGVTKWPEGLEDIPIPTNKEMFS